MKKIIVIIMLFTTFSVFSLEHVDITVRVGGMYPELRGHTDLYAYGLVGLFNAITGEFTGEYSQWIAHLHIERSTGKILKITTFQYDGVGQDLIGGMRVLALATPEEWRNF